jgi:hypothetical protein
VQSASVAFHPTVVPTGDNKLDRELTRRTDSPDGDELKMDEVMQDAEKAQVTYTGDIGWLSDCRQLLAKRFETVQ